MNLFKPAKPQLLPVEVPAVFGARPAFDDLVQALERQQADPQVRALVHLLHRKRCLAVASALQCGYSEKRRPEFDLGGAHYLDELFGEIMEVIEGGKNLGALKVWFGGVAPDGGGGSAVEPPPS